MQAYDCSVDCTDGFGSFTLQIAFAGVPSPEVAQYLLSIPTTYPGIRNIEQYMESVAMHNVQQIEDRIGQALIAPRFDVQRSCYHYIGLHIWEANSFANQIAHYLNNTFDLRVRTLCWGESPLVKSFEVATFESPITTTP